MAERTPNTIYSRTGFTENVYEANGVKISSKHNLWIDVNMPSHIGFESAIGKDCAT
jgi:hypothetical protein